MLDALHDFGYRIGYAIGLRGAAMLWRFSPTRNVIIALVKRKGTL